MATSLSPFAQRYKEELKCLLNTDRNTISFLKNLAAENKEENLNIIVAMQLHLYESPLQQQLPLLYLVDCILKTVGEPYVAHLCPALPTMFEYVWKSEGLRPSLSKLALTWRNILPSHTQSQVEAIVATAPLRQAPANSLSRPPHRSTATALPTAEERDPRMRQPVALVHQQQASIPLPVQQVGPMQQATSRASCSGADLSQVMQFSADQMMMLNNPASTSSMLPMPILGAGAALPGMPPLHAAAVMPPLLAAPAFLQQQQQPIHSVPMQPPAQGSMQQYQQLGMACPVPAVTAQLQPPPHFPVAGAPGLAPLAAPMPAPAIMADAASPLVQAPASSSEGLMSALQILSNKLGGTDSQVAKRPSDSGTAAGPRTAEQYGKVTGSLSFHPSILKEFDQSAIDDLLDSTKETRRKFLDVKFLRNRRIKAAQQSGQHMTQHWYYTVERWLLGARPDADDPDMYGPEHDEPIKAEEEYNVEEDPSQPECAISGEPFERWYDPETDKWFYQGAIVLTGEQAAHHGVMDGSIVKVHCLAGEPSKLGLATRGIEMPAQQQTGSGISTALAEAPAGPIADKPVDAANSNSFSTSLQSRGITEQDVLALVDAGYLITQEAKDLLLGKPVADDVQLRLEEGLQEIRPAAAPAAAHHPVPAAPPSLQDWLAERPTLAAAVNTQQGQDQPTVTEHRLSPPETAEAGPSAQLSSPSTLGGPNMTGKRSMPDTLDGVGSALPPPHLHLPKGPQMQTGGFGLDGPLCMPEPGHLSKKVKMEPVA